MRRLPILVFLSLALLVSWCIAAEKPPYVGEVTGGTVNVRAGAGTNHEVVKVAKQGDRLLVRGEEFGWLKIALPEGVTTWVSSKYVQTTDQRTGRVTASELNIRRKPSATAAKLGLLAKGDAVTILEKSGDWYRIAPPPQAVAYISAKYVKYAGSAAGYEAEKRAVAAAPAETLAGKYANATSLMASEYKKPLPERDLSKPIQLLKEVSQGAGAGTPLKASADSALQNALLAQTLTDDYRKTVAGHEELRARMAKMEEEFLKSLAKEGKEAGYLAEGWVEPMGRIIGRPAKHRLTQGKEVLYLLKSSKFDLDDYLFKMVGVKGTVVSAPGWDQQIIDVSEIRVLAD